MSDKPMLVHLYDDRRMEISPWSIGNSKVGHGPGVYTYSRLPGSTCPGATEWCLANCYAMRVEGVVKELWTENSYNDAVDPSLPEDATLVRIHVSGDFDTVPYVQSWIDLASDNPSVKFFGYTRSWRIEGVLHESVRNLRDMSNVQLFASVDPGTPPAVFTRLRADGWRLSIVDEDGRWDGFHCPEQTGKKESCQTCGYCWQGSRGDVVFTAH